MGKFFKTVLSLAAAAVLLASLCIPAFAAEEAAQGIEFAAYCETAQEIEKALEAGADYISIGNQLSISQAMNLIGTKSKLIIDAESTQQADQKLNEAAASGSECETYFRIKTSAGKAAEWAASSAAKPKLIGIYTGNIYFAALSCISRFGKLESGNAVQLQTGNQDGVILHASVTDFFAKKNVRGMFSFVNSAKSAERTDSARSWDDLIARGYDIIETAYPEDFAEYLKANTAEREKLQTSIDLAKAADLKAGYPNRISTYEKALNEAENLLNDGSCASYEMADKRAELDEAVKNLTVDDGKKVKGDFEITPARAFVALFGIALVLSWQIYFRKHWAK